MDNGKLTPTTGVGVAVVPIRTVDPLSYTKLSPIVVLPVNLGRQLVVPDPVTIEGMMALV